MNRASTDRMSANVSRRSFFQLTVGSITMLPTVASALAMAPMTAVAEENEKRASLALQSSIYVVSANEIGLVVRDVTIEDGSANLIQGAHVKITSRFNEMELEGDTDENGVVHFDITDLSEDGGKSMGVPVYEFNGTIEVTVRGYREFLSPLFRVQGGTALSVPTQPRESEVPYPKSVSFDEWDILYTGGDDSIFCSSPKNDIDHTVRLLLKDCPAGAGVKAGFYVDGNQLASETGKADSDGTAQIDIKGTFLKTDSDVILPAGDDHSYSMRYTVDATTYEVPLQLMVIEAPEEIPTSQVEQDLAITPFNENTLFPKITVPEGIPVIGGAQFKIWQPDCICNVAVDPYGYFLLRVSTPKFGYMYDNGTPDSNGWQRQSRKSPEAQIMKTVDAMAQGVAELDHMEDCSNREIKCSSKFSFTVQGDALAAAVWNEKNKIGQGRAQLGLTLAANYSFTENFWAGPYPIIIRFGIGLSARAAVQLGFLTPSFLKFDQYRWDYNSCGFDLQVCFAPTLSAGVGIDGLAAMMLRGNFSITYSLHSGPLPEGYEDKPNPHMRLAAKALCAVDFEFLWFTKSYTLWESDWPDWYNNWDGKLMAGKNRMPRKLITSELEGKNIKDISDEADIISEYALEQVAEFETGGMASMNPVEKKLTRYTLFERTSEGNKVVANMFLSKERAKSLASCAEVKMASASANADDEAIQLGNQDVKVENTEQQTVTLEGKSDTAAPQGASAGVAGAVAAATVLGAGAESDGITVLDGEGATAQPDGIQAIAQEDGIVATPQADGADAAAQADGTKVAAQAGDAEKKSDKEPVYILKPSNDEIAYFKTSAPDVRPIGEHDYQEVVDVTPGVSKLGLEQGFRPDVDVRLANNILMPQRSKLFTVGDADYIARIGSVIVADEVRTRIICEEINGTDRRVLDFASTYERDNAFDYDFDIDVAHIDGNDVVYMVVISGERPDGDSTTFTMAATKTYFSFLICTDWEQRAFTGMSLLAQFVDSIGDGCKVYPYRYYSNPRVVHIQGEKDGVVYHKAAVTYLERASKYENQIMGSNPNVTQAGVGFLFYTGNDEAIYGDSLDVMRAFNHYTLADPTITQSIVSGRADGFQMLEIKSAENTCYALLETDPCAMILSDGSAYSTLSSARMVDLGEYAGKITRLIPMEGGAYFLTCVDGLLKRVDVNPGGTNEDPTLEFSDFGSEELNMDDFGVVENGDVLFWPAMREDGGYKFEGEGDEFPTVREGEEGALNLIMAARVRNGKLSKAFALAEVGHPISSIRTIGNSDDHMSFLSSNTIEAETGKGELWYTMVPWVRCANMTEARPYDPLVAQGAELPVYVKLRNDGNCFLSGVELTVSEVGGEAIGSTRLDFGEDNIVPSEWNPRNAEGGLDNLEDDYALAPGTASLYLAKGIFVPKDWEGEKEIDICVTAVYGSTVKVADGLLAQGEQHSIEFIPDKHITIGVRMNVGEREIMNEGNYSASDISILKGGRKLNEKGEAVADSDKGGQRGNADSGSDKGGQQGNAASGSDKGGKQGNADSGSDRGGQQSNAASGSDKGGSAQGDQQDGMTAGSSFADSRRSAQAIAAANSAGASKASDGSSSSNESSSNGTPSTGASGSSGSKSSSDDMDAVKRGPLVKTDDPQTATTAAVAAALVGGAASIAAAKAVRARTDKKE